MSKYIWDKSYVKKGDYQHLQILLLCYSSHSIKMDKIVRSTSAITMIGSAMKNSIRMDFSPSCFMLYGIPKYLYFYTNRKI